MNSEEFKKFIKILDEKLKDASYDKEKRILARAVKLSEELGELANDVLSFNADQRKEKLDVYDAKNLPEEFADVIITTFLLAESMGIDVEKGIESKMKKINKRFNV
jgi:NTP pyrophosphatase (non-canonical NTP hydrolase)